MPIKVSEVISAAAQLVGRDDLSFKAQKGTDDREIDLLLECFHFIESEIALEYLPLRCSERLSAADGKVDLSAFSKAPLEVLSVRSLSGMGIPFSLFADHLEVEGKAEEVEVFYAYAPAKKAIGDDCELPEKMTVRLLSLGVAAEFLIAHGLYTEGASFSGRYREALAAAVRVRRKLVLPPRRWV